ARRPAQRCANGARGCRAGCPEARARSLLPYTSTEVDRMNRRRLILIIVAIVVAIPIVAAIAVYALLDSDQVRVTLERQATTWLGQPVTIGSANARVFPRPSINLRDVRVGQPVHLSLDQVELSTGLRPLLSRRIEDANVAISNSSILMPLPFSIPTSS